MYDAILWDCDGCLIDSEIIACELAAKRLSAAGYPITTDVYIQRFCGQTSAHIYGTIKSEIGFDIRERIDQTQKLAERIAAFESRLQAIPGVYDFLDQLDRLSLPMAIASGSEPDRLKHTLSLTRLYDRFSPHIYSAEMVPHGKPAPDIFLHAAWRLDVDPKRCLVIEDSENGVRAGVAAGMTVFGFSGGAHVFDKLQHGAILKDLGASAAFLHMEELARAVLARVGAPQEEAHLRLG